MAYPSAHLCSVPLIYYCCSHNQVTSFLLSDTWYSRLLISGPGERHFWFLSAEPAVIRTAIVYILTLQFPYQWKNLWWGRNNLLFHLPWITVTSMNPVTLSKQGVRREKNCVDFRSATSNVHEFVLCNFRDVDSGLVIHSFLQSLGGSGEGSWNCQHEF